jgi:hypothetical protein
MLFFLGFQGTAQTTIPTGSYIVNMGVTPQTIANGLKPYGLIYDLIRNYNIPVYWVINPSKTKDGVDFMYNGIQFKGGTFILPGNFLATAPAAVATRIAYWQGQGVQMTQVTNPFSVPVTYTITWVPRWTLDAQNGAIAETFLANAGITAFPNAYDWVLPSNLGCCNDLFVMPHADPTWATHSNLYYWNLNCKGSIWSGCHAVSVLENLVNPGNTIQMNFLSQTGLVPYGSHGNGTIPYTFDPSYASDPVAQYIGPTDLAHLNGSEQIYLPKVGGGWRPSTKVLVYDPTPVNAPGTYSDKAAIIAYGRAYGDDSRGYVMYEAGHSINKGTANDVAAQRAFFNFSFFSTMEKTPQISVNPIPDILYNGQTYTFSASASGLPGLTFQFSWNSGCTGTFVPSNGIGQSVSYTPATVGSATPCVITLVVTDNCGRRNFFSKSVTIMPGNRPPVAVTDNASITGTCVVPGTSVTIYPLSNDSDPDGDPIQVTSLGSYTTNGTWTLVNNVVTFSPATNFFGTAVNTYTVCDNRSPQLCSTGTIIVGVGTPDSDGCYPGSTYGVSDEEYITLANFVSQSGTGATLNGTALNDAEDTYTTATTDYLNFGTTYTNYLILSIGKTLRYRDKLNLYWSKSGNGTATVTIQTGQSASGPWTNAQTFTLTPNGSGSAVSVISEYILPTGTSGITHVRINPGTTSTNSSVNVWVDAIEYQYLDCVSAQVEALNDNYTVREDTAYILNVLSKDINPGSLPLTLTIIQQPTHGRLSINPDNTITYLNFVDYSGSDNFIYRICNTQGLCSSATVNLTIVDDNCTNPGYYAPLSTSAPSTITFSTIAQAEDAGLRAEDPTTNYGTNTTIDLGMNAAKSRRFIWKPLNFTTALPSNAIINSATFRVTQTGGDKNITLSVGIYQLTQSWVENQVTWNIRSTGNNWTTPGGTFNPTPYATLSIPRAANGTQSFFDVKSLIEYWQQNRGAASPRPDEMGFLMKQVSPDPVNKRLVIGTSENVTAANQPLLSITYQLPAPCKLIPNRAPLANPDYASTASNAPILVDVLANDYDVDVSPLPNTPTITNAAVSITSMNGYLAGVAGSYTGSQVGTAVISSGKVLFTPNAAFSGTAVVQYRISDASPLTDDSYIYITVNNIAPAAVYNTFTVTSNSSGNSFNVLGNDTDPDGPSGLTMSILTAPSNGTASLSGSSITGTSSLSGINILYSPYTGFTGTDFLVYRLCEPPAPSSCEPTGLCDTAIVRITVSNQSPVANSDSYTVPPCRETVLHILSNDSDPEGGVLTVQITQFPANGTLTVNPDGTVTYLPNTPTPSSDTFKYTVTDNGSPPATSAEATVTIQVQAPPVNHAPIAVNDTWDLPWNSSDAIPVLDNDSDPDGDPLSLPVVTVAPKHGIYSVTANGSIDYTPYLNFNGYDTLTYQVCDLIFNQLNCSTTPGLCATAKVYIEVIRPNFPPVAEDDSFTYPANTLSYGNVTYNDYDPYNDPLTFSLLDGGSAAVNGTLVFNANGTFSYISSTTGTYWFTYLACDNGSPAFCDYATVYITIVPVTISGVVYNDANGLCDATINGTGISTVGSISLYAYLVTGGNVYEKVPVHAGGIYTFATALQNSSYIVVISTANVTVGSPAPSPGLPSGWLATGESFGTGNLAGSGNETGTPNLTITVQTGSSSVSGVNFGIERPPVAVNDSYSTLVSQEVTGNVLVNDTDGEGSNLIVSLNTGPSSGSLSLNSNGVFTYTNTVAGTYTFTYDVCDPAKCTGSVINPCSTGTVTIEVKPCEGQPVAPGIIKKH